MLALNYLVKQVKKEEGKEFLRTATAAVHQARHLTKRTHRDMARACHWQTERAGETERIAGEERGTAVLRRRLRRGVRIEIPIPDFQRFSGNSSFSHPPQCFLTFSSIFCIRCRFFLEQMTIQDLNLEMANEPMLVKENFVEIGNRALLAANAGRRWILGIDANGRRIMAMVDMVMERRVDMMVVGTRGDMGQMVDMVVVGRRVDMVVVGRRVDMEEKKKRR
ncbi:hypothetical protein DM860_009717 [Cuscuta australis]|uniref:Uncharacterized protein n=1 Tax=Cuscuta australis TaxID=267555 RepID=A0A328DB17_9ASTE|nr:hypothetical protein DM860_009717 [Cuscuta australis]